MNWYGYLFTLTIYPVIFSIRSKIQQIKSSIQSDTGYKKMTGLSGRIFSASLFLYESHLRELVYVTSTFSRFSRSSLWNTGTEPKTAVPRTYVIIWYGRSADENRPIRLVHLMPFPVWLVCVSQLIDRTKLLRNGTYEELKFYSLVAGLKVGVEW
jgi:hypothetical protein